MLVLGSGLQFIKKGLRREGHIITSSQWSPLNIFALESSKKITLIQVWLEWAEYLVLRSLQLTSFSQALFNRWSSQLAGWDSDYIKTQGFISCQELCTYEEWCFYNSLPAETCSAPVGAHSYLHISQKLLPFHVVQLLQRLLRYLPEQGSSSQIVPMFTSRLYSELASCQVLSLGPHSAI